MSMIQISNLTFGYDTDTQNIFENVSFNIDTSWKIGLIGRNGKGKTTFLKLLLGEYKYSGTITKNVEVDYFPFEVKNEEDLVINIVQEIVPLAEEWQITKELNLLNINPEILYRYFNTLSGGEKVKVLIASLFLKQNNFLLLDEPTNHLDNNSRKEVEKYLKDKKGFILVSHDRNLLDNTVDHIISINNTGISIETGNYSSWKKNKDKQDNFEIKENNKLKSDIKRLEIAAKNTENWSNKVEKSKYGQGVLDKGYIGHKSAKMMKTSKTIEKRKERQIEEKSNLLKNIDNHYALTMKPAEFNKNPIIIADNFQIVYDNKKIFSPMSFTVEKGERVAIVGKNGSGKSSIIKLILGEKIDYLGNIKIANNLKISYVSQNTDYLQGSLKQYAQENEIDESIFKAMLSKMGVTSKEFEKDIKEYSEGQKKKVLIARSITQTADIYIWDEPLNYIDILSRIQIEEAILKYKPTMIFVEHDETFVEKISTKKINLINQN